MKNRPVFSLIIPTRNRSGLLSILLDSLLVQSFKQDDFEILVVDNASEDDTRKLVRTFIDKNPHIPLRYLYEPELGVYAARNKGIRESNGRILVFVDDDVILHPDYFKVLENQVKPLQGLFAAGGRIIPVFERQKPPWLIKFFMPYLAEINFSEKIKVFPEKTHPFGINMLVSRSVFERFGLFEETGEKHGKELYSRTERRFFNRLRQENIPVLYFPDLSVWHLVPDQYLDRKYIRLQAENHLLAVLIEARKKGKKYLRRIFWKELAKWPATAIIALYYLFSTQWEKIKPVFQYRYWQTKLIIKYLRKPKNYSSF